jgi:ribose/xylose/arabinose/galactoside ABC-type transport system permease subunit
MAKIKLKRIEPMSLGKVFGVLYALMGLFVGIFVALVSVVMGSLLQSSPMAMFGVGAIVILPILYGALGFLMGLIMAALYNFIASKVGAIEIETE